MFPNRQENAHTEGEAAVIATMCLAVASKSCRAWAGSHVWVRISSIRCRQQQGHKCDEEH